MANRPSRGFLGHTNALDNKLSSCKKGLQTISGDTF